MINITIMLLIVIGGIGFLTWDDIFENKWRFHRYRMQSKVILVTTGLLIFLPAVFFFFSDFSALPAENRLLASFFSPSRRERRASTQSIYPPCPAHRWA